MLVTVLNERGETHRYFYNSAGRLVGEETFDGRKLRYRNDATGRGVRSESNAGGITELVWDLAGQLVERKLPDGTSETFEYDARGGLVYARNAAGEFRFEFDKLGRVVRESQRVGGEEHWVAVTYDPASGRAGLNTSLGHTQRIERDVMGARVRTWQEADGGSRGPRFPEVLVRSAAESWSIRSQAEPRGATRSRAVGVKTGVI
jgi:YD repeat-containing protein